MCEIDGLKGTINLARIRLQLPELSRKYEMGAKIALIPCQSRVNVDFIGLDDSILDRPVLL